MPTHRMCILDWAALAEPARHRALARPALEQRGDITSVAVQAITAVRRDGDAALLALTERFDGVRLGSIKVSEHEFAAAESSVTAAQRAALAQAIENVRSFHRPQIPVPFAVETVPGVWCERLIRPISTVGLYVPAGSAPLPSAVIMLAIPAQLAGCPTRLLCTPPDRTGRANPAVLVAARMCGVNTVFKVGGAQAIAALAYGTATIPKADKIYGPGNAWVTAAKQLVANDAAGAACDLPAGPSEVMVVADDSARADFIASDLLAQAEHDPQSQAILVTTSAALAEAVAAEIDAQYNLLSRRPILATSLAGSRCIIVPDLHTAIDIANRYAAEHLLLQIREPRSWLERIHNAGSIFLGTWSPEPMGDYCSGTNHVLPTYGYARAYGGLAIQDFIKCISVQELTPAGLLRLGPVAVELASLEGLDGHARAVSRRLEALA